MPVVPGLMSYSYHLSWQEGKMTPERFIARCAELGLETNEWCHFPCHSPDVCDWDQVKLLKRLSDERGIACQVSGFAPLMADESEREGMLAMVAAQLEVSRYIGAERLRFDGMLNQRLSIGDQPPLALCAENLKRVVALAEQAGVLIALEDHLDFRSADLRYLLAAVDSPFLAITLDTGNLLPVGEDAVAFAEEFAPHIVNCHFKGVHFVFRDYGAVLTTGHPEQSIVDLAAIAAILDRQPQRITAHIEVVAMKSEDEDPFVVEYAGFLREALAKARAS